MTSGVISALLRAAVLAAALALGGCVGLPAGVDAVSGFKAERYMGRWYSIARLNHPFERGLTNVTAEYALLPDGKVSVLNRGYDAERGWREVRGTARLTGAPDVATLAVTFFWPFAGGYNVIALDPDYRYAMVAGPNRSYLWILAREPTLDRAIVDRLIAQARGLGFPVDELTFVDQKPRAG